MSLKLTKHHALLVVMLAAMMAATMARAADDLLPVRLVTLLNKDDQGERIGMPYFVYFEPSAEETYLVSSTSRVTIYNKRYFPIASFGKGRGLENPRGLTVGHNGLIYVCQGLGLVGKPRLSIYNQAFFLNREVVFDDIPELVGFSAQQVAVAKSGEIYLVGNRWDDGFNAAAVLDSEGHFLRFLWPGEKDSVRRVKDKPESKETAVSDSEPGADSAEPDDLEKAEPAGDSDNRSLELVVDETPPVGLPAGLRPAKSNSDDFGPEEEREFFHARLEEVKIDENGRIYLLSREASHIYVYNAQEEYLFKFGIKGGAETKLSNAVSVAIDYPHRTIYVCDYMRHTILCYDYDTGRYIYEFGGRGLGPLWFNFPRSIAVDAKGYVVVADQFNNRLQVINPYMAERRPLLGVAPLELAVAEQPAPEARKESVPVPEQPLPGSEPGPLATITPPVEVAEQTLPPAVEPEIIAPASPAVAAAIPAPRAVVAPVPPERVAGLPDAVSETTALINTPPPAALPSSPKMIKPRSAKRSVASPVRPELTMIRVAPLNNPAPMAPPKAVRVVPEREAESSSGRMSRLMSMPAALGVYGPVAALLGIGSWLLYTNR